MPSRVKHSDAAWEVAAQYADILGSDTRGLAGAIDAALAAERERLRKVFSPEYERHERDAKSANFNQCGCEFCVRVRSIQ